MVRPGAQRSQELSLQIAQENHVIGYGAALAQGREVAGNALERRIGILARIAPRRRQAGQLVNDRLNYRSRTRREGTFHQLAVNGPIGQIERNRREDDRLASILR